VDNPDLLTTHLPPELHYEEDEAITKNLVGRLRSAAAVKAMFATSLNSIYRACGMDAPHEQPLPSQKPAKQQRPIRQPSLDRSVTTTVEHKSPPLIPLSAAGPEDASKAERVYEEDGESTPESAQSPSNHLTASPSPSPIPPKRTTLLPSLYTGYISASDSSDPDEEISAFAPLQKVRKNRRGQRERRAIWLKKYGQNARHLHPERKSETTSRIVQRPAERKPALSLPASSIDETKMVKEIHPSWVAKQKLRQQQKSVIDSTKPKKIVFD
jgi:BUD22